MNGNVKKRYPETTASALFHFNVGVVDEVTSPELP